MNLPKRFLLDSNVFVSAFVENEEFHKISVEIINTILNKEKICFISDFFLNEVLDVLADKKKIPKKKFESFLYAFYSMPNVLESTIRFFNFETVMALKNKYKVNVNMFNENNLT